MRKLTIGDEIAAQAKWIDERGGNLAGYVLFYGSANDANHYGQGGELIYAADLAYFNKLCAQAQRTRSRK